MLFDFRLRTSPLVVASDASATGLGVCRTSSLEPQGLLALAALQEGHNFRGEEIGLIEVGTTPGGVRQAFARFKVKPGAYPIVRARDESKRIIQQTWPDAMVSDASTELTETEITDLMNRDSRLTTRCLANPHLLSRHGQKSWNQHDGQFYQPQAIQNVQPLLSKTCCTWLASSPTAQASRTTMLSLAKCDMALTL